MKEHKKLYKSGKNWVVATIATVALGTAFGATNVHADTTNAAAETSESQTTDQQKEALQHDIANKQQQVQDKQAQADGIKSDIDNLNQQIANENTDYQAQQDQIKKDAATKATSVNTQIDQTQSDLNTANTNVQNTQAQISDTNSQIQNLQNDQGTTQTDSNIVSVPNGQIDKNKSLLENVSRNNLWDNYYNDQQPASSWNKNVIPQNIYVSPDNDKTANHGTSTPDSVVLGSEYDPYAELDMINTNTGMTENQARELSILLLNELNHARAQRGLPAFVMTEDQFQHAMARARQDSAANLDHNETDMNSVLSNWHSENLGLVDANNDNVANLLGSANNTIASMLEADADSDWGHRDNFLDPLALNAAFGFRKLDNGYYVMTFDTTYANDSDKSNDLVANTINNYVAMGPTTGSTTTVDHSTEINVLKQKLHDLNTQLTTQQARVTNLQNKLNDLKQQKDQITSDQQSQLSAAKASHDNKISSLSQQLSAKKAAQDQLKSDIEGLQEAIAQDQTTLDNLNKGGQTPTTIPDNQKYTDLESDAVVAVTVDQNATNIPNPTLDPSAVLADTNTPASALFTSFAVQRALYPAGTKVAWANPDQVKNDAKIVGDHDEEVYLIFPDGTHSKAFVAHNVLHVNAKSDDHGSTTDPDHGGTTDPSDHGNQPSTDPTNPDQGQTAPDDHQGNQPSDQTPTNPVHHDDSNTPATPIAPIHRDNQSQPASQLPAGYQVVDNHVVDANGNIVSAWKVVNGQAVPATREAYKAQQAQQLPQTGNVNESALIGLGAATLLSMFGLAVNKKRN